MLSENFVLKQLYKLPAEDQVATLLKALKILKANEDRSITACIALALDIPVFPKVEGIVEKDGYKLTLLFTNGEERIVDFQSFFSKEAEYQKILLEDFGQFQKVKVDYDTLVWPELGFWSKDLDGKERFHNYDIDPAMLYEAGEPILTKIN